MITVIEKSPPRCTYPDVPPDMNHVEENPILLIRFPGARTLSVPWLQVPNSGVIKKEGPDVLRNGRYSKSSASTVVERAVCNPVLVSLRLGANGQIPLVRKKLSVIVGNVEESGGNRRRCAGESS